MKLRIILVAAPILCACNSSSSPSGPSAPASSVEVPVTEERPVADPPSGTTTDPMGEPPVEAGLRLPMNGVGCHTFDPVKSQDTCNAASDCAPDVPCHAKRCVAASNAPPRSPNVRCTMMLVCESIDVGRCDCVDGVCALVPR